MSERLPKCDGEQRFYVAFRGGFMAAPCANPVLPSRHEEPQAKGPPWRWVAMGKSLIISGWEGQGSGHFPLNFVLTGCNDLCAYYIRMCACEPQCTCRDQRESLLSVFPFHHVGGRTSTQVVRLSGKRLYLLTHLASLSWHNFNRGTG